MPAYGSGPWGNGGVGGGTSAALTVFDCGAGVDQQRVEPTFFGPFDEDLPFPYELSDWKFVLGSDLGGKTWRINVGDYVELSQTADWAANVLRAVVQVRPPKAKQPGCSWTLTMSFDGRPWASITFAPGDPRRTHWTLAARGGGLGPTPHAWSFRLTLASSPTPPAVTVPPPHPNPQVTRSIVNATCPASPLPVVITTATPHGLATGDSVLVSGVLGNTAANGYAHATVVDATRFSLDGVVGSGTYTPGTGTVVSPPNAAVASTAGAIPEVELPGVYVALVLQDNA